MSLELSRSIGSGIQFGGGGGGLSPIISRLVGEVSQTPFTAVVIFLSCFVLSFVAGSFIIQPQGTKAVTGLGLVGNSAMSLSTSGSAVNFDVTPAPFGTLVSALQSLTATTNVPTGYNLALSMPGAPSLATTSGTIVAPTALMSNTWGYALTRTGAVGILNDFDSGYAIPTPSVSSRWANPTINAVIKNTSIAAANDNTNIYFGAKVDVNLPSGTYSNTVRYTAMANLSNIPAPTIVSITPSSGTTAGGTAVQIVGTGFTVNDASVTTVVTIGESACTGVTISSNTPSTGRDTIYCNTAVHPIVEAVDVVVTTWKATATSTNGYTYKVPVIPMQEITQKTCPATRTLAYDVRDNATYWVQKMADGRCWMLTNLAYGGGGTNIYGDTKSITEDTGGSITYTAANYYIPTGSNRTTGTTDPSTSTSGTGQYGYLYNWCAALGVQTGTSACSNGTAPAPDTSISICPSGWRLPTGGAGGEYQALNNAVSGGSTSSPSGLLSSWLAQYSGYWENGFYNQGSTGDLWSSTQSSSDIVYSLDFNSSNVYLLVGNGEQDGFAVRCILDIPVQTGDYMQTVNSQNCPAVRTRVRDARDDATYWIQRMADGRCWMLTNLAYAGGGTNTYGDIKTITNSNTTDYTQPYYMIHTGANRTTGTTDPSTSTDGGATNPQYGYLYNWCAAMGAQTSTSACAIATTPLPDQNISICPAGWRLPTSNTGGEYRILTDAIGATTNGSSGGATGSTSLKVAWLAQYSGNWGGSGFLNQGSDGYFWSSTQYSSFSAYYLYFGGSNVNPSSYDNKYGGRAIRCISS